MSATISASGTWTAITMDFSQDPKTGPNTRGNNLMQLEQLKVNDLPELNQFVQLIADGYSINTQSAISLLYTLLTALMQRQNPTVSQATLYSP